MVVQQALLRFISIESKSFAIFTQGYNWRDLSNWFPLLPISIS